MRKKKMLTRRGYTQRLRHHFNHWTRHRWTRSTATGTVQWFWQQAVRDSGITHRTRTIYQMHFGIGAYAAEATDTKYMYARRKNRHDTVRSVA